MPPGHAPGDKNGLAKVVGRSGLVDHAVVFAEDADDFLLQFAFLGDFVPAREVSHQKIFRFLRKALAPDPCKRHRSFHEFKNDLSVAINVISSLEK